MSRSGSIRATARSTATSCWVLPRPPSARTADLLGVDYPWTVLTVVETEGGDALATPGLIWIPKTLDSLNRTYAVHHIVAHQWFYGLVGYNQRTEPFAGDGMADMLARTATGNFRPSNCPTARLDLAVTGYSAGCYYETVQVQGGLVLESIRQQMGSNDFWAAVRGYLEDHRYGIGGTKELLDALRARAGARHRVDPAGALPRPVDLGLEQAAVRAGADAPIRPECLGHLPEARWERGPPRLPRRHEPRRDCPLAKTPRKVVALADARREEADRRPEEPRVGASRDGVEGRGEAGERPAGGSDGRAERRVEDPRRELAGEAADLDRSVGRQHLVEVPLEGFEVRRQERRRDAEGPPDRQRLLVVPGALRAVERLEPGVVRRDRGIHERRVDPQGELRVERAVAAAVPTLGSPANPAVELAEPADLLARRIGGPVDDPEIRPERAGQACPGVRAEV